MAVPHVFSAGQTIRALHMNENFEALDSEGFSGGELDTTTFPELTDTIDLGTTTKLWRAVYTNMLGLSDSNDTHILRLVAGSNLTANRTLTFTTGDADRTLTLSGDITLTASPYQPGGTDVALADGGTGASLADPNADRILFWDDSAGSVAWLTVGSGLTLTDTTLTATGTPTTSASDLSSGTLAQARLGTISGTQDTNNTHGVVYQAAADCIVNFSHEGSAGKTMFSVKTDAANPPTTVVARVGESTDGASNCTFFVKKNNYYKVESTEGTPGTSTIIETPLGN